MIKPIKCDPASFANLYSVFGMNLAEMPTLKKDKRQLSPCRFVP